MSRLEDRLREIGAELRENARRRTPLLGSMSDSARRRIMAAQGGYELTIPYPFGLLANSPGARPLTPDEIAELAADHERQRAETKQWAAERDAKMDAARERLTAITDPLTRRVLDLHAEDEHGECRGCDFAGWEAEPPDWPCTTVRTIAEHYGIDVP